MASPVKAESITAIKAPAINRKSIDVKKVQPETDHLIVITDDLMDQLPLESYLSETFGIQSISRDFSNIG